MVKISCEMCRDLMPLVRDGAASEDSREAVLEHLETCPDCRSLYERDLPVVHSGEQIFQKVKRKVQVFAGMLLMFGILFGLSLTAGSSIFYNVVLMPAIGAVGYFLFRGKALYVLPVLLTLTHFVTNLAGMGKEQLDLYSLLVWSGLYSLFALLGVVIAALLHFVFRKEE